MDRSPPATGSLMCGDGRGEGDADAWVAGNERGNKNRLVRSSLKRFDQQFKCSIFCIHKIKKKEDCFFSLTKKFVVSKY